jgi:hypothetical protein
MMGLLDGLDSSREGNQRLTATSNSLPLHYQQILPNPEPIPSSHISIARRQQKIIAK